MATYVSSKKSTSSTKSSTSSSKTSSSSSKSTSSSKTSSSTKSSTSSAKSSTSSAKSTSSSSSGKTIQDYKNDYAAAQAKGDTAGMQAAHAGAESIRAQSGYSGGADGSQYIPLSSSSSSKSSTSSAKSSASSSKSTSSSKSSASSSKSSSSAKSSILNSSSSGSSGRSGSSVYYAAATPSSVANTFSGTAADYDSLAQQAAQKAAAWHTATTQAEKDKLHEEAAAINQKLGKTYNSSTGTWSGGYARPTDTAASSATSSASLGSYGGTAAEYDRINNQAKSLASAWNSATTQTEKDNLHAQATALNQLLGRTYDASTGVWSGGYERPTETLGTYNGTAEEWDDHDSKAKQYALLWKYTDSAEEKQKLHQLAAAENTALGRTYDSATGTWSGGYERPSEEETGEIDPTELYEQMFEQYYGEEAAAEREEEIRAANQAAVDQNILALNAQKDEINRALKEGNAAAEQAYMQSINPNGSLAESLAANGLLTSGLTESSQIAAGNAYQSALNANANTVNEQLAEIERAISSAQLSGDLATAEQLQEWYDTVASAAMQNVQNIISNSWQQKNYDLTKAAQEASLTGYYNGTQTLEGSSSDWEKKYQEALLTGNYNGNLTLEGLAAQDQHAIDQVTLATAQENYRILIAFGYAEEEAQKIALELANEGTKLSNQLAEQDIQYGKQQLGLS